MFVTIFMLQNQVILDTLHFYGKEGKEQQSVAPSNLISFFILSFRYMQGGLGHPAFQTDYKEHLPYTQILKGVDFKWQNQRPRQKQNLSLKRCPSKSSFAYSPDDLEYHRKLH